MTKQFTGARLPRTTPSPLEEVYSDPAAVQALPPGHPQAPNGPVWTRPADKPAPPLAVDARGMPVNPPEE